MQILNIKNGKLVGGVEFDDEGNEIKYNDGMEDLRDLTLDDIVVMERLRSLKDDGYLLGPDDAAELKFLEACERNTADIRELKKVERLNREGRLVHVPDTGIHCISFEDALAM